jgi:glycyl-tRNA synthetase beta chain
MAKFAQAAGGQVVPDEALLDKLTAMCDIPGVLEGRFEERFLSLPREVLIISLKDHQSAFTVENAKGELMPMFLTLMDRPDDPIGRVRAGNEWVVAARLADGQFFYDEDHKKTLPQHAEGLARLTFHAKFGDAGSYAAKAERLVALSESLCRSLGLEGEVQPARRAASLLKADLVTEMVKEFTDLQGVVGGLYAREEGEPEAVWQALYDQYLPAGQEDDLPRGTVGRITALADRLDTLAGMFGLGLIPSGSKDPFGLRRAAQGVVRILLEGDLSLDWEAAITEAVKLYGGALERSPEEVLDDLRPFFLDRVKFLLGRRGLEYDEIEAALGSGYGDLPQLAARAEAVKKIRGETGFLSVVLSAKRIANILKDQPEKKLDPEKLVEPAEKALYAAYQELEGEVTTALEAGDFHGALEPIGGLAEVLETFFNDVMVMAEDEELKNQRIALLQAIDRLTSGTARLTELVVEKAEHR